MMSEAYLQYSIVMWFHNHVPHERGALVAIFNETQKGAHMKSKGLQKGASDLIYCGYDGTFNAIELKTNESRHEIAHLQKQLEYSDMVTNRGGLGFFCFSLTHFQKIHESMEHGATILSHQMSKQSRDYIRLTIAEAKKKGNKTVELNFNFRR